MDQRDRTLPSKLVPGVDHRGPYATCLQVLLRRKEPAPFSFQANHYAELPTDWITPLRFAVGGPLRTQRADHAGGYSDLGQHQRDGSCNEKAGSHWILVHTKSAWAVPKVGRLHWSAVVIFSKEKTIGRLVFSGCQPCRTPCRKTGFCYASGGRGIIFDGESDPGCVSRRLMITISWRLLSPLHSFLSNSVHKTGPLERGVNGVHEPIFQTVALP